MFNQQIRCEEQIDRNIHKELMLLAHQAQSSKHLADAPAGVPQFDPPFSLIKI
jgi:hypothetical protein